MLCFLFLFLIFFFTVLGIKLRALHLLEEWFTTEQHPQSQGLLKSTGLS